MSKQNKIEIIIEAIDRATGPLGNVGKALGGMGKGYAVDQMAMLLREWSIDVALIHGGYSSVLALDGPADMKGWPVTMSDPVINGKTPKYPSMGYQRAENRCPRGT